MVTLRMCNPVISKRIERHKAMLKSALTWFREELDRYIAENEEVPWLYSERTLLGFFIGGLVREGDATVLQEFTCYKGKGQSRKKRLGRADLYFRLGKVHYLMEAKFGYSVVSTRSEINDAVEWAEEALNQANLYAEDADIKRENVFSICFDVVHCSETKWKGYSGKIEGWNIKEERELGRLDYYMLIEVSDTVGKKTYSYENTFYPALAVYGTFNT